jgi:hypothetical protein
MPSLVCLKATFFSSSNGKPPQEATGGLKMVRCCTKNLFRASLTPTKPMITAGSQGISPDELMEVTTAYELQE